MNIKKNTTVEKGKNRKNGEKGDERYEAHRLEGVVKNIAINPVKKEKVPEKKGLLSDQAHNPDKDKISKKIIDETIN